MYNPNKTISANAKGIIVCFRDCNKHKYMPYQSKYVKSIQTMGTSKTYELEKPVFNRVQQQLYGEVIYGLSVFSQEQIQKLPVGRKARILIINKRAQHFLNRLKQEIIDDQVSQFFSKLFPKSSIAMQMSQTKGYDRGYKSKLTFKELGLTQEMIAKKLIEAGFLPSNFFQLA